ncbi:MAG: ABC transporter ATP-binding protein [Lachnospiraceae bacterium]|nr:ABC transporter ATP-binding protein [Lachnospiraceae bacterium]
MKFIVGLIRRHLGMFMAGICFLAVEAMADLMQPALMSRIVDEGVKYQDTRRIWMYGGFMLLVAGVGAFGAVMRNRYASRTSQMIGRELRSELYEKVQSLSFENIDRLKPSSLIIRITNDVTQIQNFINGCMRIMVKAPVTCVGAIALIIIQTPAQVPIMAVILVIAGGLILGNMRLGYPRFGRLQKKLDRLNQVSQEFLVSVRVVKAFGAEEQEEGKFAEAADELAAAGTSAMQVMAVFSPLINLTVNMGIVVLLWLSGYQGEVAIGKLMASVNYMTQVLFALGMVSGILNMAVRASASAGRVQEIMDEVPAQKKAVCPQREGIDGSIEFEHVSFSYAGSPREALKDISVKVEAGETIGIIGPTGSGKTTLVNMIPRFYDVTGGRMLAGGRDVKEFDEAYLRSRIAIVPQKALLFSGTIEYNLSWGKENASQEEIRWAARIACADEFVEQLPQKYETMLGQEGVNLSGGQKQRLCLARALLRNPEILILDDCTSALDANTEARVLSGLRQEVAGMTVMLISQRISTVRRADRILCMDNGQSVGFGTHEELMERCALYRDIYSSQIGG